MVLFILLGVVCFLIFATLPIGPFKECLWARKISCRMKWHSWGDWEYLKFDGVSQHARCKWCKYEGLIDSQGNLF